MKIDFDTLDRMEAAGATAKVVISFLRQQFEADEAKRAPKRERDRKRQATLRAATTGDMRATVSDTKRVAATRLDTFEEFWAARAKRKGADPKEPARKVFEMLVRNGEDPAQIIAGAKACCVAEADKLNTQYIPQTVKWLRDRRYRDYLEAAAPIVIDHSKFYAAAESPQFEAWDAYNRATKGRSLPRDKQGGWLVDSEWPPNHTHGVNDADDNQQSRA